MKNILLIITLFVSTITIAQVGIGTQNPQGIFNIDGAKDNAAAGAPTAAQQLNDFVVLGSGNVGMGTTQPTQKLDVNGSGLFRNGNDSGQFFRNQIILGYNASSNFSHVIKTRHSLTNAEGNAIDFFTWNQGVDANATIGTKHLMSLLGNGRVGIGSTNPAAKLHVQSETVATQTINADVEILRLSRPINPSTKFDNIAKYDIGSYEVLGTSAKTRLDLSLNDGANTIPLHVMTWQGNGRVGIGTTAPDRMLSIVQAGNGSSFISNTSPNLMRFESTANSSSIGHYFRAKNSSGVVKETVMGINPDHNASNGSFFIGLGNGDDLLGFDLVNFNSHVSTISGSKFGVGTKIPTSKLHVDEPINNAAFQGVVTVSSNPSSLAGNGFNGVNPDIAKMSSGIQFLGWNGVKEGGIFRQTGSGGMSHMLFTVNNSNNVAMVINENRNVGIGTTTPAQRMHIKGLNNQPASSGTISNAILRIDGSSNHALDIGTYTNVPYGAYLQSVTTSDLGSAIKVPLVLNPVGGDVGIGVNAPLAKLHVEGGTIRSSGATGTNILTTSSNRVLYMSGTGATNDKILALNMQNDTSGNRYIGFENSAGFDIGTITRATASSVAFNTTSDERLKENIRTTKMGINDLMKIQVADYVYKADKNIPQTGFIAQQLHTIFPNAVTVGGDDIANNPWGVDYGKVSPLIVKATQDLKNELDSQNALISLQQSTIEKQQAQINELKQMLEKILAKK